MSVTDKETAERIADAMKAMKDSGLDRLAWLAEGIAIGANLERGEQNAESKAG